MKQFNTAFSASLPVAFGYIPLGAAFGVLLHDLNIQWYWASLMGLLVYAGSAQFMAIALLSQHVSLLSVFIATLLLNFRHVFYGLTMHEHYQKLNWKMRLYAIFSLTDETYSILSTQKNTQLNQNFVVLTSLLNHFWWILGCTLGGLLPNFINFNSTGLEFSLVCMFVVLLMEQWFANRNWLPISLAIISAILVFIVFGTENFLLKSIFGVVVLSFFVFFYRNKQGAA